MTMTRRSYFFLQLCTGHLAVGVAIALFSLLFSGYAGAAVYQCKGKGGVKVLTDRPEGLRGCVQIQTLAPSPPRPTSPTPETPTSPTPETPTPSLDLNQQPTVMFPNPIAPPLSLRETMRDPIAPKPDAEAPAAPTASETQRCAPGINPLNPLAGGNCPPAAAEPPVEPVKP